MSHDIKKISKIIDEILTYFMYTYHAKHAEVSMDQLETAYHISFFFQNITVPEKELEMLRKNLGIKRNAELEDYYWQLTGESEDSNELSLVAMMTDSVDITYIDHTLTIEIIRKVS